MNECTTHTVYEYRLHSKQRKIEKSRIFTILKNLFKIRKNLCFSRNFQKLKIRTRDVSSLLTDQSALPLTEQYHENADKTADSGARHSDKTGPSATKRPTIHKIRPDNVRRYFHRSSDERVDVDISMQSSNV